MRGLPSFTVIGAGASSSTLVESLRCRHAMVENFAPETMESRDHEVSYRIRKAVRSRQEPSCGECGVGGTCLVDGSAGESLEYKTGPFSNGLAIWNLSPFDKFCIEKPVLDDQVCTITLLTQHTIHYPTRSSLSLINKSSR